jgi:septum formation protein
MPAPLILASGSPRRREILSEAGIVFTVDAADVPEVLQPNEPPLHFARRLAREKALTVADRHSDEFILAADTIVVIDHHILGKPADPDDAIRMLRLLSNRTHDVITTVCVVPPRSSRLPFPDVRHATTRVTMRVITENEIVAYIATGEPQDKAGAYAIQGGAAPFVEMFDGEYSNVVGLPIQLVLAMLKEHQA